MFDPETLLRRDSKPESVGGMRTTIFRHKRTVSTVTAPVSSKAFMTEKNLVACNESQ